MNGKGLIALVVVVGCFGVALSGVRALLRRSDAANLEAGRHACEKLIYASLHQVRLEAPTERVEGKSEVFIWSANKIHAAGRDGVMVGHSAVCKFDPQREEVIYLGFD
jgi:hypothetical protein